MSTKSKNDATIEAYNGFMKWMDAVINANRDMFHKHPCLLRTYQYHSAGPNTIANYTIDVGIGTHAQKWIANQLYPRKRGVTIKLEGGVQLPHGMLRHPSQTMNALANDMVSQIAKLGNNVDVDVKLDRERGCLVSLTVVFHFGSLK